MQTINKYIQIIGYENESKWKNNEARPSAANQIQILSGNGGIPRHVRITHY